MSNERAARRRRARIQQSDGQTHVMYGGPAILVEGDQMGRLFTRDVSATAAPGEHVWVLTACWRVNPSSPTFSTEPAQLDLENMIGMAGPGCYVCEQTYTPEVASLPCPGDPSSP